MNKEQLIAKYREKLLKLQSDRMWMDWLESSAAEKEVKVLEGILRDLQTI